MGLRRRTPAPIKLLPPLTDSWIAGTRAKEKVEAASRGADVIYQNAMRRDGALRRCGRQLAAKPAYVTVQQQSEFAPM
jgi:hypothetical protein